VASLWFHRCTDLLVQMTCCGSVPGAPAG
ncbi:uncharacterized protein METZ01_LOCUS388388, partial [marine metagenome]